MIALLNFSLPFDGADASSYRSGSRHHTHKNVTLIPLGTIVVCIAHTHIGDRERFLNGFSEPLFKDPRAFYNLHQQQRHFKTLMDDNYEE